MYELGEAITFHAQFFALTGSGLPGITVTVNVYAPNGTLVVSAGAPTDRGQGIYRYILSGSSNTQAGEWLAVFTTADINADIKDVADCHLVVTAGFATLDTNISTIQTNVVDIDTNVDTLLTDVAAVATDVDVLLGGLGNRAITLQLYHTGTTTPIADVIIDVRNLAVEMVAWDISSASGQCSLYLSDGSYTVRLRKLGVIFAAETLTVTSDATVIIYGTVQSIPAPSDSESCIVYEYCFNQASQTPLTTVTATAAITNVPYDYADRLHQKLTINGTYSASTGLIYWEIVRGAEVLINIPEVGYFDKIIVPDAASARISDL